MEDNQKLAFFRIKISDHNQQKFKRAVTAVIMDKNNPGGYSG